MWTSLFLGYCAVATVVAAPHPFADYLTDGKITVLNHDGGHELVDLDTYLEHLKANNISLETPQKDASWLNFTADVSDLEFSALEKRQACKDTTSVSVDRTEKFVDWDVQMSNVACAGTNPFDIWVTQGYSVANTVEISGGISPTPVVDRLTMLAGVSFSRTWTTSTSIQNKGTVSPVTCGVMITKPLTTRRYGKVWQGCIDKMRLVGTFMADDRGTGSYGGVSWISGAVSMCQKEQGGPPLSRCSGSGDFK